MRKRVLIAVAAVQSFVLLSAAVQREYIRAFGEPVYIRTVPVDPQSPFRGDYVQLRYGISSVPTSLASEEDRAKMSWNKSKKCYLVLNKDNRGVAVPVRLVLTKPGEGLFIKGRARLVKRGSTDSHIEIKYGIEQYHVTQHKGRGLERPFVKSGIQVPLEIEAAIGRRSGDAVVKGWRYAQTLLMDASIKTGRNGGGPVLTVKLLNTSDKAAAIVDPPGHETVTLSISYPPDTAAVLYLHKKISLKNIAPDTAFFMDSDIKLIEPGALYIMEIDLSHPRFALTWNNQDAQWTDVKWPAVCTVTYTPPVSELLKQRQLPCAVWEEPVEAQARI